MAMENRQYLDFHPRNGDWKGSEDASFWFTTCYDSKACICRPLPIAVSKFIRIRPRRPEYLCSSDAPKREQAKLEQERKAKEAKEAAALIERQKVEAMKEVTNIFPTLRRDQNVTIKKTDGSSVTGVVNFVTEFGKPFLSLNIPSRGTIQIPQDNIAEIKKNN